ncbi:hypothetical protein [Halanaeroarchaeum sp. HSR-CO]|uniref:hypothetical protein n=1 Tax=Halanaeroarchaeum sp. HSR-CO TaxID=2866382 RepID=UPI00217D6C1B|nr:hypothetical protein [Halanaeroarchaeum sp. HSR-CO]
MEGDAPDDLLRERAQQSKLKLWLLMEADRAVVTGLLMGVVFVVLVLTGYLYPSSVAAIQSSDSTDTLFQGLLTGTITSVTLVVTLNQLVLSQELGAVGDQRERMEGAKQFRSDVADAIGAPVSPARPAQFLRALVQVSGEKAETLKAGRSDRADASLESSIEDLTGSLIANAAQVSTGLDEARFGSFDVISSALNFNYSWKLFTAERIRERHRQSLNETRLDALDELIEVLGLFGPAREHFKTLYFQWDLINLSRRILAAAVPALLVSSGMIIFFSDTAYSFSVVGVETLVLVISTAATVSLLPFLVLLAYIMRIATVAKHTLSIGPFILRETEDVADVEWDQ